MSKKSLIPNNELPQLRRRLLAWYRRNRRDLDWRRTRDPYLIWLSEIMLQQTRVAAVIPYYRRFVARFPSVTVLAKAPLDAVLHNWAGLGYYGRARNLHQAARQIVTRHNGEFPRKLEDALALPGVGHYTANAVLSIAYDEPLAVLDGNVARVLARWTALHGDLRQPRQWTRLTAASQQALATSAPSDWNQAMMELGATVCTPVAPSCEVCPVKKWCRAYALDLTDKLPTPRTKPATVDVTFAAAVLLDPHGKTLLLRQENGDGAFFSHLWQFPAMEIPPGTAKSASAQTIIKAERTHLARYVERTLSISAEALEPLATAKHTVTFHKIRLAPYLLRVPHLPPAKGARTTKLSDLGAPHTERTRPGRLPISNATRKIAQAALAALVT
jgi:A/G-specific adenine glycosylase